MTQKEILEDQELEKAMYKGAMRGLEHSPTRDSLALPRSGTVDQDASLDIRLKMASPDGDEPFDLDAAIDVLAGPVVSQKGEPDFTRDAAKLKGSAGMVAMLLKRGTPEKITKNQMDDTKLWLYGVCNLEEVNHEINAKFNVKGVLQMMCDAKNNFPIEFRQIARALTENLSRDWIKPEEPASDAPASKKRRVNTSKSQEAEQGKTKSKADAENSPLIVYRKAPDNNPIFGLNGVMKHILIGGRKTISYKIDPAFKQEFRVFGHNSISVGQWWPMMVAASRDGAHGSKMAGISGTADDGCYSIVVAGTYADVDIDSGDKILYSAPRSHDTKAPEPDLQNNGTKALLRSFETKKSIRVLRQATGHWIGVPRVGLRYDGLYVVQSHYHKKNVYGGGYIQFELRRCPNQPDIDRSRPTADEKELYGKVKNRF